MKEKLKDAIKNFRKERYEEQQMWKLVRRIINDRFNSIQFNLFQIKQFGDLTISKAITGQAPTTANTDT